MGLSGVLTVKELKPGEQIPDAGLLYSSMGSNGGPESKTRKFRFF